MEILSSCYKKMDIVMEELQHNTTMTEKTQKINIEVAYVLNAIKR